VNKKIIPYVVGGLLTISVIAFGFAGMTNAAEKSQPSMMQAGHMDNIDPKAMASMMNSPQMQQQCLEMMKSPEMQQAMKDMLKTPQMQGIMKQMLQQDMDFHQVMSDLVNSVDMSSDHSMPPAMTDGNSQMSGHNAHHSN